MIDLKNKIIFIHIPKTAGQSIEQYFVEINNITWNDRASLFLYKNPLDSNLSRSNAHLSLSMYEKYFFGGEIPEDYKIFTVVRNPYNRFLSELRYRKIGLKSLNIPLTPKALIFLYKHKLKFLKDFNEHLLPQSYFLKGNSEDRIKVIRFENLQNEFSDLMNHWNLPAVALPHKNKNIKKSLHTKNIDLKTLDFLNKEYNEDFIRFNYEIIRN